VLTIAVSAAPDSGAALMDQAPRGYAIRSTLSRVLQRILDLCTYVATSRWRYAVLVAASAASSCPASMPST